MTSRSSSMSSNYSGVMMGQRQYCMKVAVVGDQAVGKTCAVRAFSGLPFEQDYHETEEMKIWDTLLPAPKSEGMKIRAQFWDIGSRFLDEVRIERMLDGALCTLIVYDVTELRSYTNATRYWYEQVMKIAPDSFIVLVGCKSDQLKCRAVNVKQVENFASENGLFFMEMSAKTNTNVELTMSILRIRAKHTMNAQTHTSIMSDQQLDERSDFGDRGSLENFPGSSNHSVSTISHGGHHPQHYSYEDLGNVPVASISLKDDDEDGGASGSGVGVGEEELNLDNDQDGSGMTINAILGRPHRKNSLSALSKGQGRVSSPEKRKSGGASSIRSMIDEAETLDVRTLNVNARMARSPVFDHQQDNENEIEEVQDEKIPTPRSTSSTSFGRNHISPTSQMHDAVTKKEYEHLTRIIRDALDDPKAVVSNGGDIQIPISPPGPNGISSTSNREVGDHTTDEDAPVTKLRIHRTGSVTVSTNSPTGTSQVRISRNGKPTSVRVGPDESDDDDGEDVVLKTKWHGGGATASRSRSRKSSIESEYSATFSSGKKTRKIKPENMTLYNRPTKSYIHKLEEETDSVVGGYSEHELELLREQRRQAKSSKTAPDLFVDINVAGKQIGTIAVREGDNPAFLASEFVRKHRLEPAMTQKLTKILRDRVAQYYAEESTKASSNRRRESKQEMKRRKEQIANASAPKFTPSRAKKPSSEREEEVRPSLQDRPVLGTLHVKVGKGKIGKLVVREGDDPHELVSNFKKTYGLRPKQAAQIEERVVLQLQLEKQRKEQQELDRREQQQHKEEQNQRQQQIKSKQRKNDDEYDVYPRSSGDWFGQPPPPIDPTERLPSPIRYPSVLTQKQRELLHATLGWNHERGVLERVERPQDAPGPLDMTDDVEISRGGRRRKGDDDEQEEDPSYQAKKMLDNILKYRNYTGEDEEDASRNGLPRRPPPPVPGDHGETFDEDDGGSAAGGPILFNLDVNIGKGRTERISVREFDDLSLLAQEFCAKHRLSPSKVSRVQFLLEEKLVMHNRKYM